MLGNVWEWCQDRYSKNNYSISPAINPEGPASGVKRVCRGGSWHYDPHSARASRRSGSDPGLRGNYLGFRLARD